MKEQDFLSIYDSIINSEDASKMERLGEMVKRVMHWMFTYEPEVAQQAVALLPKVEHEQPKNHLTRDEAVRIVSQMDPKPEWDMEQIAMMLHDARFTMSEPPYYDQWSLLVTMSMILSDSGNTLKSEIGSEIRPAKADEILRLVYRLAIDKLKDKDGKFNIRRYFGTLTAE